MNSKDFFCEKGYVPCLSPGVRGWTPFPRISKEVMRVAMHQADKEKKKKKPQIGNKEMQYLLQIPGSILLSKLS